MNTTLQPDFAAAIESVSRTGRFGIVPASTLRGLTSAIVRPAGRQTSGRFQELLDLETVPSDASRGLRSPSRGPALSPSGGIATSATRVPGAFMDAPRRGEQCPPAVPQTGFLLPMQHVPYGSSVNPPQLPDPSAFDFELMVPKVSEASLKAYFHPMELAGALGPRSAGSEAGGTAFASNLYRVPEWGMQDFVTSDGVRHRFDVEVVFPEAGATTWQGIPVKDIHPEVADFVVNQLRANMLAAGIPPGTVQSVSVMRAHGGSAVRPWYTDLVQFVRADGSSFLGSMNIYMRDPRHTIKTLQEFFLDGLPS